MRDLTKAKLKFLSFYYLCLIFLTACTALDFYMGTVTGFTFGLVGAFFYMLYRLRTVEQELGEDYEE